MSVRLLPGQEDFMEQMVRREAQYMQQVLHVLLTGGKMHTIDDILALPEGESGTD